jgi:hypothetical protein
MLQEKNPLPVPDQPYPDWSRLLRAVWEHGIANMTAEGEKAIFDHFTKRSEGSLTQNTDEQTYYVRPSQGTTCARQAWYLRNGIEPEPMPPTIGPTFIAGHLVHETTYIALELAMPEGIAVHAEVPATLDWPEDCAQAGTADLILEITDPSLAAPFIDLEQPRVILGDIKTMVGFAWRAHQKAVFDSNYLDMWGHRRQLAVYTDSPSLNERFPGLRESGALLIGANKESPHMGIAPRFLSAEILKREREEVQQVFEQSGSGDPGPQLLQKWPIEALKYCGDGRKFKGYCPFKQRCLADR